MIPVKIISVTTMENVYLHVYNSLGSKNVNTSPANIYVPYRGLFSRGANFPEFPEWTGDSGKFILNQFLLTILCYYIR